MANTKDTLKKLTEAQPFQLGMLKKAYSKAKAEANAQAASTLKANINGYLTGLQDAGAISPNEWRKLFTFYTL